MGNIQIRNVPPELHRKLKERAAREGVSLSELLLRVAEREAARPTVAEMVARLQALPRPEIDEQPSAVIRRMRDAG
ncbi:MAG: toxin-antitoxin system HicB family antitoxin [Gaiella sp.]|jgi:plasmid stability protein|uniref:FitA-like ribbon-helix-helix domain-containing protein n=1 Tax=Gaiella sp. TaxID=2663207 RepID=UPI003C4CC550